MKHKASRKLRRNALFCPRTLVLSTTEFVALKSLAISPGTLLCPGVPIFIYSVARSLFANIRFAAN